jgi:ABC-type glycerol-3-phosphate transport system permease component
MAMFKNGKAIYVISIMILAGLALTFRPGMWLVHKPASDQNAFYAQGWADGCTSGSNSYSLLYAPLLDKPFVKEVDTTPSPAAAKGKGAATQADTGRDHYKTAWNEGFTLCRFYQSAVYELMQFTIVIATLLFIGYLLARKRPD